MTKIDIGSDKIEIDAEIVAKALKLEPHDLRERMRAGTITSRFELGEGSDAGRARLTFFSDTRRARITADTTGAILSCSAVDYVRPAQTPAPAAQRAPDPAIGNDGARRDRLDALLDDALQGTFPASDPIAISFDGPGPATS